MQRLAERGHLRARNISQQISLPPEYIPREEREKRLRQWAIDHGEDPDKFMTITEKDRNYRDRMMSDVEIIDFARDQNLDPEELMDMSRRERLISEEIQYISVNGYPSITCL